MLTIGYNMHTNTSILTPTSLFAQAYGQGDYSCGNYQQGCSQTSVGAPDTSTILAQPSVVIPGSLILAVLIALITTTIARSLRKMKARNNS